MSKDRQKKIDALVAEYNTWTIEELSSVQSLVKDGIQNEVKALREKIKQVIEGEKGIKSEQLSKDQKEVELDRSRKQLGQVNLNQAQTHGQATSTPAKQNDASSESKESASKTSGKKSASKASGGNKSASNASAKQKKKKKEKKEEEEEEEEEEQEEEEEVQEEEEEVEKGKKKEKKKTKFSLEFESD